MANFLDRSNIVFWIYICQCSILRGQNKQSLLSQLHTSCDKQQFSGSILENIYFNPEICSCGKGDPGASYDLPSWQWRLMMAEMGEGCQGPDWQQGDFYAPSASDDSAILHSHPFLTAPPRERMSGSGKSLGFKGRQTWVQILPLPLKSCASSDNLLYLDEPTFSVSKMGINMLTSQGPVETVN